MKNTIMVIAVLILSMPVFAQGDVVYPQLDSYLRAEKNNHSLLARINNTHWNYNRFIELFNRLLHPVKKSSARPVTFMDGPVVYSAALPAEIGRNASTLYHQYSASYAEPSAALQLLGIAAGIAAGAIYPKYTGVPYYPYSDRTRYLDNKAVIEAAYLQSTYHQHDR